MALPVLMNIKQVIEQRQCSGVWTHKDELPVRRLIFTSLFFYHRRFYPARDSHQSCPRRLKLTWGRSAGITPCSPARFSGSRRQRATHQWSSSAATSSPETPSTNWLMLGSECATHPKKCINRVPHAYTVMEACCSCCIYTMHVCLTKNNISLLWLIYRINSVSYF